MTTADLMVGCRVVIEVPSPYCMTAGKTPIGAERFAMCMGCAGVGYTNAAVPIAEFTAEIARRMELTRPFMAEIHATVPPGGVEWSAEEIIRREG